MNDEEQVADSVPEAVKMEEGGTTSSPETAAPPDGGQTNGESVVSPSEEASNSDQSAEESPALSTVDVVASDSVNTHASEPDGPGERPLNPAVARLRPQPIQVETTSAFRRGGNMLQELRRPSQLPVSMGPSEDSDSNPLCISASKGYLKLAKTLMESDADPNQKNTDGSPVLYLAAQGGHDDMVRLFLDKGADQDLRRNDGATALHAAANAGHESVVKILLSRGASVDMKDNQGATPLYASIASPTERVAIVKRLLDAGAEVNAADNHGSTTLYVAAWNGHIKTVKVLLQRGAEPNQADDGLTGLYIAAWTGQSDIVKLLLKSGADPNLKATGGSLPVHMAAQEGFVHVIHQLVDAGTDIDSANDNGDTALHLASAEGHVHTVEVLLDLGADLRKLNKEEKTPYIVASEAKQKQVKRLLKARAQMNRESGRGLKPSKSSASLKRRDSTKKRMSRSKTAKDVRLKKTSLGTAPGGEEAQARAAAFAAAAGVEDGADAPLPGPDASEPTRPSGIDSPVAESSNAGTPARQGKGVPALRFNETPGQFAHPESEQPRRRSGQSVGCWQALMLRLGGRRSARGSQVAPMKAVSVGQG